MEDEYVRPETVSSNEDYKEVLEEQEQEKEEQAEQDENDELEMLADEPI
jgi:hypothetical protein